jgi:photosystem II stability/assembly factor-like uncharacterized protein
MKRAWMVCITVVAALAAVAAFPGVARALAPDGAHGWYWQMPQPATDLNGCTFAQNGALWAVGLGGLIERSTDGGVTWAAQPTGSDADLWSVTFLGTNDGWVVGGQATADEPGVILHTTDGGADWSNATPTGLTATLTNVSFSDALHGWIGTAVGTVLKTTDAGADWTEITLPRAGKNADVVDFVDATHGWAGGPKGRIWRTTNAGRTWTSSRYPGGGWGSLQKLVFTDRFTGYGLTMDEWGDSMIIATHDGGRSWMPLPTPDDASVTDLCSDGLGGLWAVGESWDDYDTASPTMFLHSTDGGFRWGTATVSAPAMPYTIAAHGSSVCSVGDGILLSTDAGATWRSGSSGQQYEFADAAAVSATDLWAVDTSGALLHSTDGARFIEQPVPAPDTTYLQGVAFADHDDGWVVGTDDNMDSVIFHTSDGGVSWQPQQSNLDGGLWGIDAVDAQTAWAVSNDTLGWNGGANLPIEHTTDGGATWMPQFVPGNMGMIAIDFMNADDGWIGGYWWSPDFDYAAGAIYATTNGGFTWTREKLPKAAPAITGLQFVSPTEGWAVGVAYDENDDIEGGSVLHTTDGGATWTQVPGLDDAQATTVHFVSQQDGWLGGENGVYQTTDGGTTWQRVAAGLGVESIVATDTQHVWAFGDGFLVSTLDPAGDTAAPVTIDEHAGAFWHRKSATIDLTTQDIGTAGVTSTETRLDDGAWQSGTSLTVPAYADHHFDGEHTVLYYSTDAAGNREQTESRDIGIDTLGPACAVPHDSVVDTGHRGLLYFMASDAMSGIDRVTIAIKDRHDRVLRHFVEYGYGDNESDVPYYVLTFHCGLKPGTYHVVVTALDVAGNHQATVGRGVLRVVRKGAPPVHLPWWGVGMDWSTYKLDRMNRGLRPAWLLRFSDGPTMVRAPQHRGAWHAAQWPVMPGKRTKK